MIGKGVASPGFGKWAFFFLIPLLQVPRFGSLKGLLTDLLKTYLTAKSDGEQLSLEARERELQCHIDSLPRNQEDKERLLSSGYHHQFWDQVCENTIDFCKGAAILLTEPRL